MTRKDWLEHRKKGLGGTDIAAILWMNPYRKPIDVYLDKRGLIEETEQSDAMLWGTKLEPIISDHYAQKHGVELIEPGLMVHKDHDWIIGTPDRLVVNQQKGFEAKTANSRMAHKWGEEGTDDVPDAYLIQCAWYMCITEYPVWDLAALIGASDYREYTINRNEKLESRMIEVADEFWHNNILAGVAPPPDGSKKYAEYIQQSFPKDSGVMLPETTEIRGIADLYALARVEYESAKEKKEKFESILKSAVGKASGIEGDGWKFTWKKAKDSETVDYKIALDNLLNYGVDPNVIKQAVADATTTKPGTRRIYFSMKG